MPFLFAASLLGILWAGSRSNWTTSAGRSPSQPVHGLPAGRRWTTWVVAWNGKKICAGPQCVTPDEATAIEHGIVAMRPGAHVFRFVRA